MKLFEPQVQIIRRNNVGEPDSYFLHAVTFCDRTCFYASGHAPLPTSLDTDGSFVVELYIARNEADFGDFDLLTPVVHSMSLGQVPFEDGEGDIVVDLVLFPSDNDRDNTTNGEKVGKRVVSSTGALEDDRPIAMF